MNIENGTITQKIFLKRVSHSAEQGGIEIDYSSYWKELYCKDGRK